jgi:hypothetical protein
LDEIAELADRITELAAVLARLESIAKFGFALMDMSYASGYEDGRDRRPLKAARGRRKDHRGSHLRLLP